MQPKQMPMQFMNRQMQTSAVENAKASSKSTSSVSQTPSPPPPPPKSQPLSSSSSSSSSSSAMNENLWIAAITACILGGGAYYVYNSNGEPTAESQEPERKPVQPKKRKFSLRSVIRLIEFIFHFFNNLYKLNIFSQSSAHIIRNTKRDSISVDWRWNS